LKKINLKISEEGEGLHVRPSSLFVKIAAKFPCEIKVIKEGIEINGKSIMGLMMLALSPGDDFEIIADGEKEDDAIEELSKLVNNNFKI
jgi:phosphocarrier protein HPr